MVEVHMNYFFRKQFCTIIDVDERDKMKYQYLFVKGVQISGQLKVYD